MSGAVQAANGGKPPLHAEKSMSEASSPIFNNGRWYAATRIQDIKSIVVLEDGNWLALYRCSLVILNDRELAAVGSDDYGPIFKEIVAREFHLRSGERGLGRGLLRSRKMSEDDVYPDAVEED
jgi:hypothetical protein